MNLRNAVATVWIKNVMMRHGLPPGDPNVTDQTTAGPAAAKSALWPAIISAALTAAGLPIAGAAVNWWFSGTKQPPAAEAPAEAPPFEAPAHDGSLYQFLEDQNLHLPQ